MSTQHAGSQRDNIGYACTAEQCASGRGAKVAMRWLGSGGARNELTFGWLEQESNRFANVLARLGCEPGQPVFIWLPKMPEQFVTFLGALKQRLVVGTLFANFGEDGLLDRLGNARPVAVVTKRSHLRRLERVRPQLPSLKHVLVVDDADHQSETTLSLPALLRDASEVFDVPPTDPQTPSVLHYTSGSTGKPKGVLHVHGSLPMQRSTAAEVLGLRSEDVFWCTADQGWITGTSYGIIGPWSLGVTQVHYGGAYEAKTWFEILERERVTVWYTAPTALRMLMREPPGELSRFDLSRLRAIFSVGEPLSPEVIRWAEKVLRRPVHDTWFQTETGAIMIANRPGLELKPGSMGKPAAGIEPAILDDDGAPVPRGTIGHLCLREGWASMFRTYLRDEAAYRGKFRRGFYDTGDRAKQDGDGYYWFIGRGDDVINTAGHLVSPFEVESALLEVPEVVESGVVGVPDEILYEKIVAFVHLRPPHQLTPELALKLRLHVSNRVSSIATPQEILCLPSIPKNKAGKILRRVLRARHLGLEAGDLSTMEADP